MTKVQRFGGCMVGTWVALEHAPQVSARALGERQEEDRTHLADVWGRGSARVGMPAIPADHGQRVMGSGSGTTQEFKAENMACFARLCAL